MSEPNFDLEAAHQYFSAECFNRAWDLIDKVDRTKEEEEQMVRLSLASTWHWTQRADCTPVNLSVGYWQTSRIYALLGQAENARRYGQLSLQAIQGKDVEPFYTGYAYEALARAESVAGNKEKMMVYLVQAHELAEKMIDLEAKEQLENDLDLIR